MSSSLPNSGHPRNLFPDKRRFMQTKQPHISREFEFLTREYPLLLADRVLHEALCHLLDDKLQEILDGYRSEKAESLKLDDYRRGTMYMRNATTLCFNNGSINAYLTALENRADQPNLSNGTRSSFRVGLWFYKRLLAFCYVTMQNAKNVSSSRQTIIPGPPSEMKVAPRTRHLRLVGG